MRLDIIGVQHWLYRLVSLVLSFAPVMQKATNSCLDEQLGLFIHLRAASNYDCHFWVEQVTYGIEELFDKACVFTRQ